MIYWLIDWSNTVLLLLFFVLTFVLKSPISSVNFGVRALKVFGTGKKRKYTQPNLKNKMAVLSQIEAIQSAALPMSMSNTDSLFPRSLSLYLSNSLHLFSLSLSELIKQAGGGGLWEFENDYHWLFLTKPFDLARLV